MYLCELYEKYNFPLSYSPTSKKDVYDFLIHIYSDKSHFLIRERGFKKFFPEIYKDISDITFPPECDNWSLQQKLYHYFNDDLDLKLGICYCNNRCKFISIREGYHEFCSTKCLNKSQSHKDNVAKTNINKYGGVAPACSKDVQNKMQQTCIERIGTRFAGQSQIVKEKSKITRIKNSGSLEESYRLAKLKGEETNLSKFGVKHYAQSQKFKEYFKSYCQEKWNVDNVFQTDWCKEIISKTSLEKYGVEHYTQSKEFKKKHRETWDKKSPDDVKGMVDKCIKSKRENHSFNTSKVEELFNEYLIKNRFNFIRQYKSDLYPFPCDFYFPDIDLYIEINAHFSHGKHPFNPLDKGDTDIINIWKSKNTDYYNNAIHTWTHRDPTKRKIAKDNNLNYIEIFSNNIDEIIDIFSKVMSDDLYQGCYEMAHARERIKI